ncbi:MAG: hypothetical protein J1E62_12155 [Lachnospiraceae bacterium]|nr:hypothetical protein [Lachnospiraceae bacterium]
MENKFRGICELCTALTFTAFGINIVYYPQNTNPYACMCSALIATFTLLANRASDEDMAKKGIGTGRYEVHSKIYRYISKIRLLLETLVAGFAILLILAYFLMYSNQGKIFEGLAYYETRVCIWLFLVSEWLLFIISLVLVGIEKMSSGQNTMDSLLQ